MRVNIIKTPREIETWEKLITALMDKGYNVHCAKPVTKADLTIALSGKFENVALLTGRKCVVFHRDEWKPRAEVFELFEPLLQAYYDDFIDLTGTDLGTAVKKIEDYISDFKRQN